MTSSRDRSSEHTGDPRLALIEDELRRGNFLRGDDRPLARILEDDAATVAALDMNLEELTSRMQYLFERGRAGMGDSVQVDDVFQVTVREDRGAIPSPWLDHYFAPKALVEVINLRNGRTLRFSLLGLHLIRSYGFFQGKGSPFRIEPRDLHDFFQQT